MNRRKEYTQEWYNLLFLSTAKFIWTSHLPASSLLLPMSGHFDHPVNGQLFHLICRWGPIQPSVGWGELKIAKWHPQANFVFRLPLLELCLESGNWEFGELRGVHLTIRLHLCVGPCDVDTLCLIIAACMALWPWVYQQDHWRWPRLPGRWITSTCFHFLSILWNT
jgi:hypothetical protein